MKKLLKINLLVLFLFLVAGNLNGQKFGHVNSGNLLVKLPETKAADEKLKVYRDSLVKIGEARADSLEKDFLEFAKAYQSGEVRPADAQKKQAEFQQRRDELANFEDEVVNMVAVRRQSLLSPILDKVQDAIDEIGKEGNYTMIFDTSIFNTILFAVESNDIEPLVKQKLGIQ
jgi:outer membrane protein